MTKRTDDTTAGGKVSLSELTIRAARKRAALLGKDIILIDEAKSRGVGRLRLRVRPAGHCKFYFRYADSTGKMDSLAFGNYAADGNGGLTLAAARQKAHALSVLYQGQSGIKDLRAHLEREAAEACAHVEAAAREREEAARIAKVGTLSALLHGYRTPHK